MGTIVLDLRPGLGIGPFSLWLLVLTDEVGNHGVLCQDGFKNLAKLKIQAEFPLEFTDTTPLNYMPYFYICDSSTGKKVGVGSAMEKASALPLPAGNIHMEEVYVKVWFLQALY
ncbi:UPF0183 protein [Senna tora]|uniref:UPF0183 protein n=1 Tax=Senna tora TaxID=362788 RepID=A0A834TVG7_9FABA|nr:UPF0183 protein [Senna tora]